MITDDAIDESLRRSFAVPDLSALQQAIDDAAGRASPIAKPVARRRIAMVVAAAAAAAVLVVVIAQRDRGAASDRSTPTELDPHRHLGNALARLHAEMPTLPRPHDVGCVENTPPDDACNGELPTLAPSDELELLGECGAPGGVECARFGVPVARLVHLRDRNGAEILVCIERRDADPRPTLADDAALRIFRRELGAFVLYEVTPLDAALAIDRFAL